MIPCNVEHSAIPQYSSLCTLQIYLFYKKDLSLNMEKLLKDWRQDAVHRHQYETAIYIGDKLLALTSMQAQVTPMFGDVR